MKRKDTNRNTSGTNNGASKPHDLQERQRLRNLIELAVRIGRREGLIKSLSPIEKDKLKRRVDMER